MLKFEDLPEINSERWMSLEDLSGEIWKDVNGFEGIYRVSNYGRIKSLGRICSNKASEPDGAKRIRKEHIMKSTLRPMGYRDVRLKYPNGKAKSFPVHRLVGKAFIPNPKNKPQIDHIDTNPSNNTISNLRWCTAKENKHNPISFKRHLEVVGTLRKPVVMLDSFGYLINRFESVTAAAAFLGRESSHLSYSLKEGILVDGYRVVYASEYDGRKDYYELKYHSRYNTINNASVIAYKDSKIVDVFLDQTEAAKFWGVSPSMISRRCTFYNSPNTAKKKFKTPIIGTDKILNLKDISPNQQKEAIEFLKQKYSYRHL